MPRSQSQRALALVLFSLLPALSAVFVAGPTFSQAPFYQGKTITLIVRCWRDG